MGKLKDAIITIESDIELGIGDYDDNELGKFTKYLEEADPDVLYLIEKLINRISGLKKDIERLEENCEKYKRLNHLYYLKHYGVDIKEVMHFINQKCYDLSLKDRLLVDQHEMAKLFKETKSINAVARIQGINWHTAKSRLEQMGLIRK
ncbi:hypothetical protein [Marasmitruncus massiliensis]|uniref:hypothetical protein n=1 Tax=Marasmitruncus massiliensis TaxID=1944642 RepID=UPI000C7ADB9E|nr:hypothetical protein [Marasmitruncus massiliensis]